VIGAERRSTSRLSRGRDKRMRGRGKGRGEGKESRRTIEKRTPFPPGYNRSPRKRSYMSPA
jgi:hypothetical protein